MRLERFGMPYIVPHGGCDVTVDENDTAHVDSRPGNPMEKTE